MKKPSPEKEVARAVRYLVASKTPLVRKRAWRRVADALRALRKAYPLLSGKVAKIPRCPLCRIPLVNFKAFAAHMQRRHGDGILSKRCAGCAASFRSMRGLCSHLSRHANDLNHFIDAATAAAFAKKGGIDGTH